MERGRMNILIIGAGSLGQAFARRLYKDHKVILLDQSEWCLAECTLPVEKLLMDMSDWKFSEHPCDVVILTGAYKHVNMGETDPEAFIKNNIVKTLKVMKEAYKYNADLIFTSTDKAVEPISLYGYTKAIGEILANNFNFNIVRLGNILSSTGSVIPLWEKQINEGLPITITDERMVRYVIEDFEAVDQIWDMFKSGKKLIIPQCRKIRLLDLLTEVLKKHGLTIDDVSVQMIGLRPGEKIEEKLEWTS